MREVGLEPTAWSQTLYVPPWRPLLGFADLFEQIGGRIAPSASGLILMEATRQAYARIRPRAAAQLAIDAPVLAPQPAASRAPLDTAGKAS